MASYTSEFHFPNFLQYYLTLYNGDYDTAATYGGEPLPSSRGEFEFFVPGTVSLPDGEEVYHIGRPRNEYASWPGVYESYFDGYWGEDRFSYGSSYDAFNNPHGSGFEKVEEAYLGEEHRGRHGRYYGYDNDVEMQRAYDYNSWSGDEYGSEEDFGANGTEGFDDWGEMFRNWDEMKLCESIFGDWPYLLEQNKES